MMTGKPIKVRGAKRYVIYFARSAKGKLKKYKVMGAKARKLVIKNLKKNGYYKFRVLAQRKVGKKWKTLDKSLVAWFVTKVNKTKTNPVALKLNKGKVTLEDIADYCELTIEQVTMLARGETPKLL